MMMRRRAAVLFLQETSNKRLKTKPRNLDKEQKRSQVTPKEKLPPRKDGKTPHLASLR